MLDFEKALFPKPKMNPLILHPPVCSINIRYTGRIGVPPKLRPSKSRIRKNEGTFLHFSDVAKVAVAKMRGFI